MTCWPEPSCRLLIQTWWECHRAEGDNGPHISASAFICNIYSLGFLWWQRLYTPLISCPIDSFIDLGENFVFFSKIKEAHPKFTKIISIASNLDCFIKDLIFHFGCNFASMTRAFLHILHYPKGRFGLCSIQTIRQQVVCWTEAKQTCPDHI